MKKSSFYRAFTRTDYEKIQMDYEDNFQDMIEYLNSGGVAGDEKHRAFLNREAELQFMSIAAQKALGMYAYGYERRGRAA